MAPSVQPVDANVDNGVGELGQVCRSLCVSQFPSPTLAEEPCAAREPARNVLGTELSCCCADVHGSGIGTGFYRDGYCSTGPDDAGRHTVCIEATEKFLAVSAAVGNPLHQPIPQFMFPGVRPGDRWCLCASRYAQLIELERESAVRGEDGEPVTGFVPRIHIRATHERSLEHMDLEALCRAPVRWVRATLTPRRLPIRPSSREPWTRRRRGRSCPAWRRCAQRCGARSLLVRAESPRRGDRVVVLVNAAARPTRQTHSPMTRRAMELRE